MSATFIFALDFWVYNSPDSPPNCIDVAEGEYSYRIYEPCPNNPFHALAATTLGPNTSIPFLATTKVDPQDLAVPPSPIAMPLIYSQPNDANVQILVPELNGTINPKPGTYLPSNLLRIDIYGKGKDLAPKAENIKTNLMRIVRWRTEQWWITRRSTSLSKLAPLMYEINEYGDPIAGNSRPSMAVGAKTLAGYEKYLDAAIWEQSVKDTFFHIEPPTHWTQVLDAQYFLSIDDIAQAGLLAASGCDILKEGIFETIWQRTYPGQTYSSSQRWKMISGWQMPKHVDTGLNSLIGRSYKTEYPQEWDNIDQLWEVRNNVAHGKSPAFGIPPIGPTDNDMTRFISSARHLLSWLETIL